MMTEKNLWSTSVGNWFGLPIRLHLFMMLFFVAIFSVEWHAIEKFPGAQIVGTGLVTCLVVLVSVLIHELAHLFAMNNLGGQVRAITLMPWGGNSDFEYPDSVGCRAIIHLAGPFVSGFIFVIGAMLLLQTGSKDLFTIVNPFGPHGFDAADWEKSLLSIVTWVNFQIFAVNLIPCFPFDGANILRTLFESLNNELSKIKIETTIMAIGHLVGVAMIGVAWLLPQTSYNSRIEFPWAILMWAGITLIFCSRYSCHREIEDLIPEDWDEDGMDPYETFYDDENDPASIDFTDDEQYSQWLNEKRAERERIERELERREDLQADSILEKLHRDGIGSLSQEEQELLDRVSERIRRRRLSS